LYKLWIYPWAVYEQQPQSAVQNLDCRLKKMKMIKKNVKKRKNEKKLKQEMF